MDKETLDNIKASLKETEILLANISRQHSLLEKYFEFKIARWARPDENIPSGKKMFKGNSKDKIIYSDMQIKENNADNE